MLSTSKKAVLSLIGIILLLASVTQLKATTVTGSFISPGLQPANGYLYFTLVVPGNRAAVRQSISEIVVPITVSVQLNSSGAIPSPGVTLVGNDDLTPTDTYYQVQVRDDHGNLLGTQMIYITGSTTDLGTATYVSPLPTVPTFAPAAPASSLSTTGANGTFWGVSGGTQQWLTPSGSGITLQSNGTNNSSQSILNFLTSSTNSVGLTITPSNPSGGEEQFEITGNNYTGNAATATIANGMIGSPISGQFWGYNGTAQGWYTPSGSGTINSGTTNQLGYYAANGTTLSPLTLGTNLSITSGTLNASGGSSITLQTNGTVNADQSALNFLTSTTNAEGLTVTPVYSTGGGEQFEITGAAYTGNAATATTASGMAGSPTNGEFWGYSGGAQGWYTPPSSTGTNATQIQSIPVSATAPTGGEALIYNATNGDYEPTAISGSGTVSSVALQMPGTIFDSSVTGSPVTGSGTFAPALKSVPADYFLGGPLGTTGTNVSLRQNLVCRASGTSQTCTFPQAVQSGDLLFWFSQNGIYANYTVTDTLSTSFTDTSSQYAYGTAVSSGADTLTWSCTSCGSGPSSNPILILDISGASSLVSVTEGAQGGSAPYYSVSLSLTPSAVTDGFIAFEFSGDNCTGSYGVSNLIINPASSLLFEGADVNGNLYGGWLYAPQNTSSQTVSMISPCNGNDHLGVLLDLAQSSSAASGPPVYRRITEGALPVSAKSSVQVTTTYNVSSDTVLSNDTNTSLVAATVSMPPQGAPFRVLACWSDNIEWSSSGPAQMVGWVSDGSKSFAESESGVAGNTAGGMSSCEMSPVSYSNSQSVTFTLYANVNGPNTPAATITEFPALCSSAGCTSYTTWSAPAQEPTHLNLTIFQSQN